MKVCFISFFQKGYGGGAGRVGHELAEHFAQEYGTALICPAEETGLHEGEGALKVFGVASAGEGDVKIPRLSVRNIRRIFDFLDKFKPQIVHAHEPALLGLIGQLWAKMNGAYFVHTSHILPQKVLDFGAIEVSGLGLLETQFGEKITDQVLADFYENCDAIIALNDPARMSLRDFGYRGRIFVIPNGRDLEMYQGCKITDIGKEEKVLTYIGHLTERKNQLYLVEVLDKLPSNYCLNLVGKALNPSYEENLRSLISKRDLDNVNFTGQVPYPEIPNLLEKTHLFVSASKMEVQSLVVIEALASHTPVVGLSNETIDELVDSSVGRRLPVDANPREFARIVENLGNSSSEEYNNLCENAWERVSELDWSNIVARTAKVYRKLVSEEPFTVTRVQGLRLGNLIARLPQGKAKAFLTENLAKLKDRAPSPPKFPEKFKNARKVSRSTWIMATLTVAASWIGYLVMKYLKKEKQS